MNNYFFNEKTIAILKNGKKTIIIDVDNVRVINKNIKKVIENNCLINGSTLEGRKNAINSLIKVYYKQPILINNDIILIQISSLKNKKCLLIVLNKIFYYENMLKNLKIKCANNYIFYVKISKRKFENLVLNGLRLNNIIKSKKNSNEKLNFRLSNQ